LRILSRVMTEVSKGRGLLGLGLDGTRSGDTSKVIVVTYRMQ
jgi:hypothetical protein